MLGKLFIVVDKLLNLRNIMVTRLFEYKNSPNHLFFEIEKILSVSENCHALGGLEGASLVINVFCKLFFYKLVLNKVKLCGKNITVPS